MKAMSCRMFAAISLLLLLPFCIAMSADAAETTSKLSLWCVKDDEIVDGMHWQIFRVGHREENDYVFEGDFSECRPTLGDRTKDMAEWDADTVSAAAETLRVYAITDQIPNLGEGFTDENGYLEFSGLEDGLYLVVGHPLQKGMKTYIPGALFFEVISENENVLNAFPKIVRMDLNDQETRYSVAKVWKNNENQPRNTEIFITCEIYCDGALYDTVRLDQSNDWSYMWSDEDGHEWLVKEKEIPAGYTVVYIGNHYRYFIVNTYEPEPDETTATTAATTGATTAATAVPPPGGEKLTQTGQLWWPVPILCIGGLTLISVGVLLRKKDNDL